MLLRNYVAEKYCAIPLFKKNTDTTKTRAILFYVQELGLKE